MKWNIKIFTYLDPNYLLKVFFNDKEYLKKIINELVFFYYRISKKVPIEHSNLILGYINMYPRISHFITGKDYMSDIVSILDFSASPFNRYIFTATNPKKNSFNCQFIYSNYILPHISNSSIPFSFGLKSDNKFKLLESNVYYFEMHVDTFVFRKPSFDEILKIGIIDSLSNCFNFEKDVCYGINFFNNSIVFDKEFYFLNEINELPFKKGDTIGIGIEYLKKNSYSFFITVEGKKLDASHEFETRRKLKLVMQIKMFTGINMNFGDKEFKFNIEKYINENKSDMAINSSSNKLIKHHDVRYFRPYKSKLQMFINKNVGTGDKESIYNLI